MERSPHCAIVLAFCLSTAAPQLRASDPDGRTTLEQGALVTPGGHGNVRVLRDGGFLLSTSTSRTGAWLVRFDAQGRVVARERVLRAGALGPPVDGALSIVDPQRQNFDVEPPYQCTVERAHGGLLRSHLAIDPGPGPTGHANPVRGGNAPPRAPPLAWFGRDCRASAMPDPGFPAIGEIHADPLGDAAYVLGGASDAFLTELVHLGRDRVRWRRATIGNPAILRAEPDGVQLAEYGSPSGNRLTKIRRDGSVAWQLPVEGLLTGVPHTIVTRTARDERNVTEIEGIDAGGRVAWRTRLGPRLAPVSVLDFDTDAMQLTLATRSVDVLSSEHPVVVVDVATSRIVARIELDSFERARARLPGGEVLVERREQFLQGPAALDLRTPTTRNAVGDYVPGLVAPVAFLDGGDDTSVVLADREGGTFTLQRTSVDGTRAWRAVVPRPGAIAATTDRVCLAYDRVVACRDLGTGAALPEQRIEPLFLQGATGRGTRLHLVGFTTGQLLTFDVLERDGTRVASTRFPVGGFSQFAAFDPSGGFIAYADKRVLAFDASGRLRFDLGSASLGGDPGDYEDGTAGALDGGAIVSIYNAPQRRREIVRLERDGRVRWRLPVGPYAAVTPIAADWLLWGEGDVARLDDRDGGVRWRTGPSAGLRLVVATSPDGRLFATAGVETPSSFGRVAGDAWWHDASDGRRVGVLPAASSQPVSFFARPKYRFDASGRLLRLAAEIGDDASALVLERYALRTGAPTVLARTAAHGLWVARGLDGHAIQLSIDDAGRVAGRWFTFGLDRTNDFAGQRWFEVSGTARADRLALEIATPSAPTGRDDIAPRVAGSAQWRQLDCARAELEYRFSGAMEDVEGRMLLERADTEACAGPRGDAASFRRVEATTELWQEHDAPTRAVVLRFAGDGTASALWPTFAPPSSGGVAQWLTLRFGRDGAGEIHRTVGGRFETGPTENTWAVGIARLSVHGCNATFQYAFDDDELAAPFAGAGGMLSLRRRGCN